MHTRLAYLRLNQDTQRGFKNFYWWRSTDVEGRGVVERGLKWIIDSTIHEWPTDLLVYWLMYWLILPYIKEPPKCQDAMGIESGAILDDEISSSSRKSEVDAAIYGWLNNNSLSGSWAAQHLNKKQWLQVDLITYCTQVTKLSAHLALPPDLWYVLYSNLCYGKLRLLIFLLTGLMVSSKLWRATEELVIIILFSPFKPLDRDKYT